MKISITAHDCARIYLSNADLRRLGLSAFSGEPPEQIRLLVSGIAAFLSQLGLFEAGNGELGCVVSEVFDGIVVQITAEKSEEAESTELLFIFDSEKDLKSFCCGLSGEIYEKVAGCELYKLGRRYFLITELNCSRACLLSVRQLREAVSDEALIQKAREYGTFLSRTPIEDIRKLRYP